MTVKMCIKPYASPFENFSDSIGVSGAFNRNNQDRNLHVKRAIFKRKSTMPKTTNNTIKDVITQGNTVRKLYGLRAPSQRIPTRKEDDYVFTDNKIALAPRVEVKKSGDNLVFFRQDDEQQEERDGGIVTAYPAPKDDWKKSNVEDVNSNLNGDDKKINLDVNAQYTNKSQATEGSDKASAGTMAFVQILLHTLSCSLSCEQKSCRKMGMVLKHYHSCQEKRRKEAETRNTQDGIAINTSPSTNCNLCQQFAKIVAQHSMYLCNMSPHETGCPVPMCDKMRKIRESRKPLNANPTPMQS